MEAPSDAGLYELRGQAEELYKLGKYAEAYCAYRALALEGDVQSQRFVGWMSLVGRGTERDISAANKWLSSALEGGETFAEYLLGHVSIANGDFIEAARRFRLASSRGITESTVQLARMYISGAGIPKDMTLALELLKDAEEHGDIYARKERAEILLRNSKGVLPRSMALVRYIFAVASAGTAIIRNPYKWDPGIKIKEK